MSAKGFLLLLLWLYLCIALLVILLLALATSGAKKDKFRNAEVSGEDFLHALDKAALTTNLSHAGVIVLIGLMWPRLLMHSMKGTK